jgi:hypothetical protein
MQANACVSRSPVYSITGGRLWQTGGAVGNYWLAGVRLSAVSLATIIVAPMMLGSGPK